MVNEEMLKTVKVVVDQYLATTADSKFDQVETLEAVTDYVMDNVFAIEENIDEEEEEQEQVQED